VRSHAKQYVRERIWRTLENEGAARFPGARGRIPNFRGAEAAAERLAQLPEWEAAAVVKSNPDAPQLPVRRRARRDGKTLYMAVPRLAEEEPFVRVAGDPTIKKALAEGMPSRVEELGHVDLVVCGTVAVNRAGVRVGKGGGYSDLEYGVLIDAGKIDSHTTVATTVHPTQVLRRHLMMTAHDLPVDLIATPRAVIEVERQYERPRGILWDHLQPPQIREIPLLERMGYA
jgi:5-formyltetrahydrofolate cyclo-ligase